MVGGAIEERETAGSSPSASLRVGMTTRKAKAKAKAEAKGALAV
jgi:hypothetical protein